LIEFKYARIQSNTGRFYLIRGLQSLMLPFSLISIWPPIPADRVDIA
jgi:hypothetical protein